MIVRPGVLAKLISAIVACGLLVGSASANVIIEDFSNAAIASYTTYGGNEVPDGSAHLTGWEIGGRYFTFEDVGADRMMTATQGSGGYDIGIKLAATSSEYKPVWDVAQASEAISLADASDLEFQLVNRLGVGGTVPGDTPVPTITMYYYDTSAAATQSVQVLVSSTAWAKDEVKTLTASVDSISGFDKSTDLVYGFRVTPNWVRIGSTRNSIAWSSVSYTRVPEPATLVLLALGATCAIRRRARVR